MKILWSALLHRATITRNPSCGTWYLPHCWVHYDRHGDTIIFQRACAKLPYFYFRYEIWRRHRVPRPRFFIWRRNSGDLLTYRQKLAICVWMDFQDLLTQNGGRVVRCRPNKLVLNFWGFQFSFIMFAVLLGKKETVWWWRSVKLAIFYFVRIATAAAEVYKILIMCGKLRH